MAGERLAPGRVAVPIGVCDRKPSALSGYVADVSLSASGNRRVAVEGP